MYSTMNFAVRQECTMRVRKKNVLLSASGEQKKKNSLFLKKKKKLVVNRNSLKSASALLYRIISKLQAPTNCDTQHNEKPTNLRTG